MAKKSYNGANNTPATEPAPKAGFTPKVKKLLTMPLIKPAIDVPVFIKITSAMYVGKKMDSGASKDMDPATLVHCINLETGEPAQIIIPAVLKGIFDDEYPNEAYVQKGFSLTKHAKSSGKKYHPFTVAELEL